MVGVARLSGSEDDARSEEEHLAIVYGNSRFACTIDMMTDAKKRRS
jgi:hypothetical protein